MKKNEFVKMAVTILVLSLPNIVWGQTETSQPTEPSEINAEEIIPMPEREAPFRDISLVASEPARVCCDPNYIDPRSEFRALEPMEGTGFRYESDFVKRLPYR